MYVVDATVWIDLHLCQHALQAVFGLGIDFVSPDLVISEELPASLAAHLRSLGMQARTMASHQIPELSRIAESRSALSVQDISVYLLACDLGAGVLTGDGPLRRFCQEQQVTVHGTLWLMDCLVQRGLIAATAAEQCLNTMLAAGSRLPTEECDRLVRRWKRLRGGGFSKD
ncbi:MAG: DUF3368 domain-containing protein [Limnochordaceae bacterium]|nr:DUF3368 domain-containing protein [Limnochordaceae bacterium]